MLRTQAEYHLYVQRGNGAKPRFPPTVVNGKQALKNARSLYSDRPQDRLMGGVSKDNIIFA